MRLPGRESDEHRMTAGGTFKPFKPFKPLKPFKLFKLFKLFEPFKLFNRFKLLNYLKQLYKYVMSAKNFEELEIWKLARSLTGRIYQLTGTGKFTRDYGLCSQIQRASVSVMSNIAEGFERGGNREFSQFLAIAKGSCGEVRCQLYVALDQGYLDHRAAEPLIDQHKKLSIMIYNFMEHLKGSAFKGHKYKPPKPDPKMEEFDALLQEHLKGKR